MKGEGVFVVTGLLVDIAAKVKGLSTRTLSKLAWLVAIIAQLLPS
jgi:hypothetical protein